MATSTINTVNRLINAQPGRILKAVGEHPTDPTLSKFGYLFALFSAGLFTLGYYIHDTVQTKEKTWENFELMKAIVNTAIVPDPNDPTIKTLTAHYPDGTQITFTQTQNPDGGYRLTATMNDRGNPVPYSIHTLEELKAKFAQELVKNYDKCVDELSRNGYQTPTKNELQQAMVQACCNVIAEATPQSGIPEGLDSILELTNNCVDQFNIKMVRYQFMDEDNNLIARIFDPTHDLINTTLHIGHVITTYNRINFLKNLFTNHEKRTLQNLGDDKKITVKDLQIHYFMYQYALQNIGTPQFDATDLAILHQTLLFSDLTLNTARSLPPLQQEEIDLLKRIEIERNNPVYRTGEEGINYQQINTIIEPMLTKYYRPGDINITEAKIFEPPPELASWGQPDTNESYDQMLLTQAHDDIPLANQETLAFANKGNYDPGSVFNIYSYRKDQNNNYIVNTIHPIVRMACACKSNYSQLHNNSNLAANIISMNNASFTEIMKSHNYYNDPSVNINGQTKKQKIDNLASKVLDKHGTLRVCTENLIDRNSLKVNPS